jgi:aspartate--ammonia ligase
MRLGEGLCTDIRAVRKDYFLDHDHSVYVDPWDWARVVAPEQPSREFLKEIVNKPCKVLVEEEPYAQGLFLISSPTLPKSFLRR